MNNSGILGALQISDSGLPVGKFAHSYGLESFLRFNNKTNDEVLLEFIETQILQSSAPLDGAALVHAYSAANDSDFAVLISLDRIVTAKKITECSRYISCSAGRNLANIGIQLSDAKILQKLQNHIENNLTSGNSAIVSAVLACSLQIECDIAVLMELQSVAKSILSAAVRLGHISTMKSQFLLAQCNRALCEGLDLARSTSVSELHSFTPELDILMLKHGGLEFRTFIT